MAVAMLAVASLVPSSMQSNDSWYMIAMGRRMIATKSVPTTWQGPFSWYQTNSQNWLACVIYALVHDTVGRLVPDHGHIAVRALHGTTLCLTATLAWLMARSRRHGSTPIAMTFMAPLIMIGQYSNTQTRPHMAFTAMLLAHIWAAWRIREDGHSPARVAAAVGTAVIASQLQHYMAVTIPMTSMYLALWPDRKTKGATVKNRLTLIAVSVTSLLAVVMLAPAAAGNIADGILYSLSAHGSDSQRAIGELMPGATFPKTTVPTVIAVVTAVALDVLATGRPAPMSTLALIVVPAAIQTMRNQYLVIPLLAAAAALSVNDWSRIVEDRGHVRGRLAIAGIVTITVMASVLIVIHLGNLTSLIQERTLGQTLSKDLSVELGYPDDDTVRALRDAGLEHKTLLTGMNNGSLAYEMGCLTAMTSKSEAALDLYGPDGEAAHARLILTKADGSMTSLPVPRTHLLTDVAWDMALVHEESALHEILDANPEWREVVTNVTKRHGDTWNVTLFENVTGRTLEEQGIVAQMSQETRRDE
jgi:hypothetical protein